MKADNVLYMRKVVVASTGSNIVATAVLVKVQLPIKAGVCERLDLGVQPSDRHIIIIVEPDDIYDPECCGLPSFYAKSMLDCPGIESDVVVA